MWLGLRFRCDLAILGALHGALFGAVAESVTRFVEVYHGARNNIFAIRSFKCIRHDPSGNVSNRRRW